MFKYELSFIGLLSTYVHTFSVCALNSKLVPRLTEAAVEVVRKISDFLAVKRKYGEKIAVEKDALAHFLASVSRSVSWFIGKTAYKLVKIEMDKEDAKQSEKKDQNSSMVAMILNSKLLSGGIETRHVISFSEEVHTTLLNLTSMTKDARLEKALKEKPKETEEDSNLAAMIHEGKNQHIDRLI